MAVTVAVAGMLVLAVVSDALMCAPAPKTLLGVRFSESEDLEALKTANTASFETLHYTYDIFSWKARNLIAGRRYECLEELVQVEGVTHTVLRLIRDENNQKCPVTGVPPLAEWKRPVQELVEAAGLTFTDASCGVAGECVLDVASAGRVLLCPVPGVTDEATMTAVGAPVQAAVRSCAESVGSGFKLTQEEEQVAVRSLDDICGDTFCGGDYNYFPEALTCPSSEQSCTLQMGAVAYDGGAGRLTLLCRLTGLSSKNDLINVEGNWYAEPLYNAVLDDCVELFESGDAYIRGGRAVPQPAPLVQAANKGQYQELVNAGIWSSKVKDLFRERPFCSIEQVKAVPGFYGVALQLLQEFADTYFN